ncbi:unnamed protein product [Vitrella brassicaformis CCMP3155]|uniref:Far11/STRP C-terminal domain-containing protein n=5 Tax=Vitrella brassicaformis TaxID=1169539 RepID=A0A0G4FYU3_VITBC|nr:unnamed protein product [Vitrella brassicaformis CCMP3155]|eukprot:CEM20246.1 unnamed protein product [Vitrella brassicaformis CCMP3155]
MSETTFLIHLDEFLYPGELEDFLVARDCFSRICSTIGTEDLRYVIPHCLELLEFAAERIRSDAALALLFISMGCSVGNAARGDLVARMRTASSLFQKWGAFACFVHHLEHLLDRVKEEGAGGQERERDDPQAGLYAQPGVQERDFRAVLNLLYIYYLFHHENPDFVDFLHGKGTAELRFSPVQTEHKVPFLVLLSETLAMFHKCISIPCRKTAVLIFKTLQTFLGVDDRHLEPPSDPTAGSKDRAADSPPLRSSSSPPRREEPSSPPASQAGRGLAEERVEGERAETPRGQRSETAPIVLALPPPSPSPSGGPDDDASMSLHDPDEMPSGGRSSPSAVTEGSPVRFSKLMADRGWEHRDQSRLKEFQSFTALCLHEQKLRERWHSVYPKAIEEGLQIIQTYKMDFLRKHKFHPAEVEYMKSRPFLADTWRELQHIERDRIHRARLAKYQEAARKASIRLPPSASSPTFSEPAQPSDDSSPCGDIHHAADDGGQEGFRELNGHWDREVSSRRGHEGTAVADSGGTAEQGAKSTSALNGVGAGDSSARPAPQLAPASGLEAWDDDSVFSSSEEGSVAESMAASEVSEAATEVLVEQDVADVEHAHVLRPPPDELLPPAPLPISAVERGQLDHHTGRGTSLSLSPPSSIPTDSSPAAADAAPGVPAGGVDEGVYRAGSESPILFTGDPGRVPHRRGFSWLYRQLWLASPQQDHLNSFIVILLKLLLTTCRNHRSRSSDGILDADHDLDACRNQDSPYHRQLSPSPSARYDESPPRLARTAQQTTNGLHREEEEPQQHRQDRSHTDWPDGTADAPTQQSFASLDRGMSLQDALGSAADDSSSPSAAEQTLEFVRIDQPADEPQWDSVIVRGPHGSQEEDGRTTNGRGVAAMVRRESMGTPESEGQDEDEEEDDQGIVAQQDDTEMDQDVDASPNGRRVPRKDTPVLSVDAVAQVQAEAAIPTEEPSETPDTLVTEDDTTAQEGDEELQEVAADTTDLPHGSSGKAPPSPREVASINPSDEPLDGQGDTAVWNDEQEPSSCHPDEAVEAHEQSLPPPEAPPSPVISYRLPADMMADDDEEEEGDDDDDGQQEAQERFHASRGVGEEVDRDQEQEQDEESDYVFCRREWVQEDKGGRSSSQPAAATMQSSPSEQIDDLEQSDLHEDQTADPPLEEDDEDDERPPEPRRQPPPSPHPHRVTPTLFSSSDEADIDADGGVDGNGQPFSEIFVPAMEEDETPSDSPSPQAYGAMVDSRDGNGTEDIREEGRRSGVDDRPAAGGRERGEQEGGSADREGAEEEGDSPTCTSGNGERTGGGGGGGSGSGGDSEDSPDDELPGSVWRHREIIAAAVSGILFLLLKGARKSRPEEFSWLSQLISDMNGILVVLKYFNNDTDSSKEGGGDKGEAANGEGGTNGGCENGVAASAGSSPGGENSKGPRGPHRSMRWMERMSPVLPCLQHVDQWHERHSMWYGAAVYRLLKVLYLLSKNCPERLRKYLVQYKAPFILKRLYKLDNPVYTNMVLKIMKKQVRYMPKKWKQTNMKTISHMYSAVPTAPLEDWLLTEQIGGEEYEGPSQAHLGEGNKLYNTILQERHFDHAHTPQLYYNPLQSQYTIPHPPVSLHHFPADLALQDDPHRGWLSDGAGGLVHLPPSPYPFPPPLTFPRQQQGRKTEVPLSMGAADGADLERRLMRLGGIQHRVSTNGTSTQPMSSSSHTPVAAQKVPEDPLYHPPTREELMRLQQFGTFIKQHLEEEGALCPPNGDTVDMDIDMDSIITPPSPSPAAAAAASADDGSVASGVRELLASPPPTSSGAYALVDAKEDDKMLRMLEMCGASMKPSHVIPPYLAEAFTRATITQQQEQQRQQGVSSGGIPSAAAAASPLGVSTTKRISRSKSSRRASPSSHLSSSAADSQIIKFVKREPLIWEECFDDIDNTHKRLIRGEVGKGGHTTTTNDTSKTQKQQQQQQQVSSSRGTTHTQSQSQSHSHSRRQQRSSVLALARSTPSDANLDLKAFEEGPGCASYVLRGERKGNYDEWLQDDVCDYTCVLEGLRQYLCQSDR